MRRDAIEQDDIQTVEAQKLTRLIKNNFFKQDLVQSLEPILKMVTAHRHKCRANGIDFPVLTPVIVLRKGHIDLHRADLSPASIANIIQNLVKMYPDLTAPEIATAIARAFPDYRPGGIIEHEISRIALPH